MKKSVLVPAAAATLLTLAACGGGGGGATLSGSDSTAGAAAGGGAGDAESITVGLIPVAEFFPVYIAEQEGYFEEEGLDVQIEVMSNAASIVPSVLNGQLTFGTTATPPFLVAVDKGIPITAVANSANTASGAENDTAAFLVKKGSDISSVTDLEGRTVAVNALSSLPHVAAASLIKDQGGDPSKVQFVAMPFPDMLGALEQGRVDATIPVEPFMTQALAGGQVEAIAPLYADVYAPGTTHTLMFGSTQFVQDNPEIVKKFQAALARANELVAEDEQVLRDALVEHGGMPQQVADVVKLPVYETEFEVEGMQDMADRMLETGFLTKAVKVSDVLAG